MVNRVKEATYISIEHDRHPLSHQSTPSVALISIDGVELGGYIDLLATDESGNPLLIDYKTGFTDGQHYDIQFALHAHAVRGEFANPETRILRIGEDEVRFESVTAASEAELRSAVARAKTMLSDEPRPGVQCTYCPYP